MDINKKYIFYSCIIILLILNVFAVKSCQKVYSRYNKNFRDTIYVDPHEDHAIYNMHGCCSGCIQGFYTHDKKHYIIVRRFDNSKLDTIEVGYHDYDIMQHGDTICNKFDIPHDTIYIHDVVHLVEQNPNNKYHAFLFKGFPTGIVVEGHASQIGNDSENIADCKLIIRKLGTSELKEVNVGKYDYDRIHLGDTIYGQ